MWLEVQTLAWIHIESFFVLFFSVEYLGQSWTIQSFSLSWSIIKSSDRVSHKIWKKCTLFKLLSNNKVELSFIIFVAFSELLNFICLCNKIIPNNQVITLDLTATLRGSMFANRVRVYFMVMMVAPHLCCVSSSYAAECCYIAPFFISLLKWSGGSSGLRLVAGG